MGMIKAVLFDYDGVMTLEKTGSGSVCNYISKHTGIDKSIFENEYRKYNKELSIGKISHIDMWDELCKNLNKNIPIDILYDSFTNTPIDAEMHELVLKIKNQGIKTGLITDNKVDRMEYIDKKYHLKKYFDIISISAALGFGKETDKIFLETLKKAGIKPEESIFIDNQEQNLIIPKNMGIKTIHFDDKERDIKKLRNELEKYGIPIALD